MRGTVELGPAGCGRRAVEVGLWGERFGTRGLVPGRLLHADPAGGTWLSFPVRTGLGEGTAELLLAEGGALLPLGVRPGEHAVALEVSEGHPEGELRSAWAEESATRLDAEQAAWAAGAFRILDGDEVVGDVRFRGDGPALLSLYDQTWLTDGVVAASVESEGAELVLGFLVEPSLEEEEGRLRVNVPTGSVVVPMGSEPVPGERHLRLEAGRVDPARRQELQAAAVGAADAAEEAWLRELIPQLLAASEAAGDGACARVESLPEEWSLLLRGYEIRILPREGAGEHLEGAPSCLAEIRPTWEQHRRRFRGRLPDDPAP